jgi:hypothetical protein
MHRLTLIIGIVFMTSQLFAQIGLNVGYNFNDAINWKITNGDNANDVIHDFYGNGLSFGLDYWFRLPNQRVEFTPEINYQSNSSNYFYDPLNFDLNSTMVSFFANTNFYIFDFKGDCNCPTFSKRGPELQKGFFLRISPGITYFNNKLESEVASYQNQSFTFSIGAGAGIDFGVSDLLTITPIAMLRYYPEIEWRDIFTINVGINEWDYPKDKTTLSQIYVGLRIGMRFDYR